MPPIFHDIIIPIIVLVLLVIFLWLFHLRKKTNRTARDRHFAIPYHHIKAAAKQLHTPVYILLPRIRRLGIGSVEVDLQDAAKPEKLKKMLSHAGFTVSCVSAHYELGRHPDGTRAYRLIDVAEILGANKVLIVPGTLRGLSDNEKERELQNMLRSLKQICFYACEKSIAVTIKNYFGKNSSTPDSEGVLYFAERIPYLQITYDSGNFCIAPNPESEITALKKMKERIIYVQMRDRLLTDTEKNTYVPCHLGAGSVPLERIAEELENMNYTGIYTIENYGATDYWKSVTESAAWLKKHVSI